MTKTNCDKKIAFLILAHDNIEILNIFINQLLAYSGSYVFLHIDIKSSIKKQDIIQSERIIFIEQTNCSWGDYSLVQCIINLYEKSINYNIDFDYYSLHSDSDLAIENVDDFVNYLSHSNKHAHLRCSKLPRKGWGLSGGFDRIDLYFPKILRKKMKKYSILRIIKVLYMGLYTYTFIWKIKKRKYNFYGGSLWHTVDEYGAKSMLGYIKNNPEFCELFKNSLISDELFFNTAAVLAIGTDKVDMDNNLRYIDWSKNNSIYGGSPKILTDLDYKSIIKSGRYFARKFNTKFDSKIIHKIIDYKRK